MKAHTDYLYARQKMADAIEALAVGEEEVRARLISALDCLAPLRVEQLPPSLQKEYAAIFKACTKSGPIKDHEGKVTIRSIQRTIRACRKKTAAALAQRLFDLYSDLTRKMNPE